MEINPNFSVNAQTDFNLVSNAKGGDQKAYAELMQRYKSAVYFIALRMVSNKDDAMDLTIETFGRAFEKIDKYKADFAFSTWLFKIATNNCIDFLRRKKLNIVSMDDMEINRNDNPLHIKSELLNPEEGSIKRQQKELLKIVVDKLPPRYRTLVTLRYYDELSYEEIALQLNIPIGTVKAQLFRSHDLMFNAMKRKKNLKSDF